MTRGLLYSGYLINVTIYNTDPIIGNFLVLREDNQAHKRRVGFYA